MPFLARTHPRLSAAAVLGLAVGILIPAETLVSKILIGWNAGVWTYLVLMLWLTSRARADDVKRIAEIEDENAGLVLFVTGLLLPAPASIPLPRRWLYSASPMKANGPATPLANPTSCASCRRRQPWMPRS